MIDLGRNIRSLILPPGVARSAFAGREPDFLTGCFFSCFYGLTLPEVCQQGLVLEQVEKNGYFYKSLRPILLNRIEFYVCCVLIAYG